jgi:hypothetical protein
MVNPKRDGTLESHPSAKCAEGWATRHSENLEYKELTQAA